MLTPTQTPVQVKEQGQLAPAYQAPKTVQFSRLRRQPSSAGFCKVFSQNRLNMQIHAGRYLLQFLAAPPRQTHYLRWTLGPVGKGPEPKPLSIKQRTPKIAGLAHVDYRPSFGLRIKAGAFSVTV